MHLVDQLVKTMIQEECIEPTFWDFILESNDHNDINIDIDSPVDSNV